MKLAVAYLRRSTDRQDQSIEDQKRECLRFAQLHGYRIIAFYIDDAVSGTSIEGRTEFLRMMADAESPKREFEAIIVYSFSRFSRSDIYETFGYLGSLKGYGVRLESCTEDLSQGPAGIVMEFFNGFKAHTESRDLSRDTLRGLISHASDGWWNGGVPPYGYDLEYVSNRCEALQRLRFNPDGTKKLTDLSTNQSRALMRGERLSVTKNDRCRLVLSSEDRWRLIIRIFDVYVNQGRGLKAIAEVLNSEGIPSPRGKSWTTGTIRSIITNPVYTGKLVWNRRTSGKFHVVRGGLAVERERADFGKLHLSGEEDWIVAERAHPAIIEFAVFLRAQQLLSERGKKHGVAAFRSGRAKTSPYLLSGLIHCTRCGHKYHGMYTPKGKANKNGERLKTLYYACNSYVNGKRAECPNSKFRQGPLETDILKRIGHQVDAMLKEGGRDRLQASIARDLVSERRDPGPERQRLRERIKTIDIRVDTLLESLTPENKRFVDPRLVALGDERDGLEARLRELETVNQEEVDCDALADEIMASVSCFEDLFREGTIEEQKEFIRLFVERIELDPDKKTGKVYMKKFPVPT